MSPLERYREARRERLAMQAQLAALCDAGDYGNADDLRHYGYADAVLAEADAAAAILDSEHGLRRLEELGEQLDEALKRYGLPPEAGIAGFERHVRASEAVKIGAYAAAERYGRVNQIASTLGVKPHEVMQVLGEADENMSARPCNSCGMGIDMCRDVSRVRDNARCCAKCATGEGWHE